MIVTLKTLQEDTFTVEIDPSESVKHLKEKIEKLRGHDYSAKSMKLMYAGKFLVDGKQVRDYNVEEKKFVIVVTKQTNHPVLDAQEGSSVFINGSNQSDRERVHQMEYDQMISNIVELGFSRADVVHALTASYHNPDRAVEYLINTISGRDNNAQDMEMDLSDEALMRQALESGPPSPTMSDVPSQERIFEIFSEAMAECRNRTRQQDELAEREHERITRTYAEMEAGGLCGPLSAIREELNNTFGPMSAGSANVLSSLGVLSNPVGFAAGGQSNPHGSTGASTSNPARSAGAFSTTPMRSAGAISANAPRSAGDGSTNHQGSTGSGSRDRAPPLLCPPDYTVPLITDPDDESNAFFPIGDEYAMFREIFGSAGSIGNTPILLDRDHDAIDRLTQLGFSNQRAIEAYYVCDKNENAAAEYLLSQKFD